MIPSQKKILLIVNPIAGRNRKKALEKEIAQYLNADLFKVHITYTEYAGHGKILAKKAVNEKFDIVVAVGGDGSVNEVIQGLYGSDVILGIIPKGSGNGLARGLQIPINQKKAIQLINQIPVRSIKIGKAADHIFASTIGVGFDRVVVKKFEHSNKRGFFSYIKIILQNLFAYPSKIRAYHLDKKIKPQPTFLLNICNSNQLGYGFKLTKKSSFFEDHFELFILKKFPIYLTPWIALRAFLGKFHNSKYVEIHKVKQIQISHPHLTSFQIDGECKPCPSTLKIEILPKKLKVITPLSNYPHENL